MRSAPRPRSAHTRTAPSAGRTLLSPPQTLPNLDSTPTYPQAIWQATAATSLTGKFLGNWLPVSAFAAIGFEHSVANMFLIPMGMAREWPRGGRAAECCT